MMTPEEKNIKYKIDNLSDIDVFFNDTALWERVETTLDQKKSRKRMLVWYWVAACLLIGLSLYFFLLPANYTQSKYTVTKPTATPTTKPTNKITNQPKSYTPKISFSKTKIVEPITIKDSTENSESEEKLLTSNIAPLNSIEKSVISENSKDILQHPIAYKAQRVTTLTLPLIPDKMLERESFTKRALRQIKNLNTEGKIDLRELNIEPRNVWAYLERSFFHDTTKTTTTKSLKQ